MKHAERRAESGELIFDLGKGGYMTLTELEKQLVRLLDQQQKEAKSLEERKDRESERLRAIALGQVNAYRHTLNLINPGQY